MRLAEHKISLLLICQNLFTVFVLAAFGKFLHSRIAPAAVLCRPGRSELRHLPQAILTYLSFKITAWYGNRLTKLPLVLRAL